MSRAPEAQPATRSEAEYLLDAAQFYFRARLDKAEATGPVIRAARGSEVWDVTGRVFLDFNSGMMASALGHNDRRIIEAIRESCEEIIHSSSSLFNTKEIELAKKLADRLDPPIRKSFFLLTGSDANEAAISVARRATGALEVASPHASFHGLNDTARSLTFGVPAWHKGYGPPAAGVHAVFAPYCYRCPLKLEFPSCDIACVDAGFELLDAETTGPLAAVLTEPMFSAGGVIDPPPGWLPKIKKATESRGALLILDEQQTGLGKTGTTWMYQQEGAAPDIMTIGKHFGGGIAISAVSTSDAIESRAVEGGFAFSHSHASDPIACNAALATLAVMVEDEIPDRARMIGDYWRSHLQDIQSRHEIIGDVRGRGIIQGVELVRDRVSKEPLRAGHEIARSCLANGLIFSVRRNGSVLRFVPPFTTTTAQLDRAAEVLETAVVEAESAISRTGGEASSKLVKQTMD